MLSTLSNQGPPISRRRRVTSVYWALVLLAIVEGCGTQPELPPLPEPPQAGIHLHEDVAAAIERAREQVLADTRNGDAWLRLGMTYEANGLPQQAAASYEAVVLLLGQNARAWYRLGWTRSQLGEFERAIEALERAATIDPNHAPIAWRRGYWRLEIGDLDGAERDFRLATRLDSSGLAGLTGLARVALQRGDDDDAAELLQDLIARAPREPYFQQLLGKAYLSLGRTEEAQRLLRRGGGRGVPVFFDPWQRGVDDYAAGFAGKRDRALTAIAEGRMDEAVEQLRRLLLERPGDGALSYALAVACMQTGRTAEAIEVLQAGVELNPGHNLLYVAFSDAYRQAGDLDRALEYAERAVELSPARFMTHFRLAGVLEALGRRQEALEAGNRALARDPDNIDGLWWLGNLQSVLGRWRDAAHSYEHLIRLDPNQPGYWLGLGYARLRLGELDLADTAVTEIQRHAPSGWPPLRRLQADLRQLQRERDVR